MAQVLDLGRSTTHRYATTLVALGYLEQGPSRKYGLSARAADTGFALFDSMPVRRVAREYLRALRARTGYTVNLAVLGGSEVVYIDCWHGSRQGQYAIDEGTGPGTHRPVYCTAAGKAILASLPAAEQNGLIAKLKLRRNGPKTLASKATLRAELECIATKGDVAVEDEELLADRRAFGAAVSGSDGSPLAAVELVVPAAGRTREELVAGFASPVLAAARRISQALHKQGSDKSVRVATNSSEGFQ